MENRDIIASPPYPWFGGKSAIANVVWQAFGDVPNYIEPFFGSGAVWRLRPHWPFDDQFIRRETINDYDGHVSNFWRAVKADPNSVVEHMADPPMELDLHARGNFLFTNPKAREFVEHVRSDDTFFDAKRAGWWCWFVSNWIGGLPSISMGDAGVGVSRRLPHLGRAGVGVSRQLPQLGNAGRGEYEQKKENLRQWMYALRDRLCYVRVCCGDWSRVCGRSVTWNNATPCAVFLDPPYSSEAGRDNNIYSSEDLTVAHNCREWAIEEGKRDDMRIALCGYQGEGHEELENYGWNVLEWKTQGGYSRIGNTNNDNCQRERIWFSPACLALGADKQEISQLGFWA